jgi:hypothetical protein
MAESFSMRKSLLPPFLLALAACTPVDDTKVIVGQVLQTLISENGKVTATLTRSGGLYRVYLQGKDQPLAKMIDSKQNQRLNLSWGSATSLWVHGICGGEVHYVQGTGNGYPNPDKAHAIQVGFRCD